MISAISMWLLNTQSELNIIQKNKNTTFSGLSKENIFLKINMKAYFYHVFPFSFIIYYFYEFIFFSF